MCGSLGKCGRSLKWMRRRPFDAMKEGRVFAAIEEWWVVLVMEERQMLVAMEEG